MSEDYKDLLARFILIFLAILFVILVIGSGVWPLFAVAFAIVLVIYAFAWALVRIYG